VMQRQVVDEAGFVPFIPVLFHQIITSDEAERRGVFYDCLGTTYLFDLDFFKDEYTVDVTYYGNITSHTL